MRTPRRVEPRSQCDKSGQWLPISKMRRQRDGSVVAEQYYTEERDFDQGYVPRIVENRPSRLYRPYKSKDWSNE